MVGAETATTITMATINKLVSLVSRSFPRARIWLTEYGYQSNPPDKLLGVSLPLQASTSARRLCRLQDGRASTC